MATTQPAGLLGIVVAIVVVGGASLGLWFVIVGLLMALAGWGALEARYAGSDPDPRVRLRLRSGRMGLGVQFRQVLTLTAGPAGLGIAIWPIFAGRHQPLLVPWSEVTVERNAGIFAWATRLRFGTPERGALLVSNATWDALKAGVPQGRMR